MGRSLYDYSMAQAKRKFHTVVWKEGDYYVAQCLNVDVSSFGKTKKEALTNINEALSLYYEENKSNLYQEVKRPELMTAHLVHA